MKEVTLIITEEQKNQFKSFVEAAADKVLAEANLNKEELQKLIENSDEFQSYIVTTILKFFASNQLASEKIKISDECQSDCKSKGILDQTNIFALEEVDSCFGYLSGYKPKTISEQISILRQFFPGIGFADEKLAESALPPNAEGWFAIPRWERITLTYCEAVQKVLYLIKHSRNGKLYNYQEDKLGPLYLRQSRKSIKAFQKLGNEQKDYDILIIPAQFGFYHRGRSIRRALEVMNASEFGLGMFAVGTMLLTHPERLMNRDDLWIDCAGDELALEVAGDFSGAPVYLFRVNDVEVSAHRHDSAQVYYGTASGFFAQ